MFQMFNCFGNCKGAGFVGVCKSTFVEYHVLNEVGMLMPDITVWFGPQSLSSEQIDMCLCIWISVSFPGYEMKDSATCSLQWQCEFGKFALFGLNPKVTGIFFAMHC